MGRAISGVLEPAPTLGYGDDDGPTDHALVAALRGGDDRAFECLYSRYQRRIHAYVLGMCKDHARAEDLTQEVFVSALRRMRETERPIAFKPWVYEIAKNACIDHFRRSRRAEEVSREADDGLAPADYGRLVGDGPTPEAAVVAKQDLDNLCGAFGGLSDVHHEVLVMRELEGFSYREIGERLGMSRPAVESTLFRARRRLSEEYDELVSGERCLRIQGIIATADAGRLGTRDVRRLARHVAHCQGCRREALAAGFDSATLRQPLRARIAGKVAGWLPFPVLARRAAAGRADEAVAVGRLDGSVPAWLAHLASISDQLGAGWTKAAAAAALLLAGVGAGVGTNVVIGPAHPAGRSAGAQQAGSVRAASATTSRASAPAAGQFARSSPARVLASQRPAARRAARAGGHGAKRSSTGSAGSGSHSRSGSHSGAGSGSRNPSGPRSSVRRAAPAAGGGAPRVGAPGRVPGAAPGAAPAPGDAVDTLTRAPGNGSQPGHVPVKVPPVSTHSVTPPVNVVKDTVDQVVQAVPSVTGGGGSPASSVPVPATAPVTDAVGTATKDAGDAVGPATKGIGDAVGTVTKGIGDATGGGSSAVGKAAPAVSAPADALAGTLGH